MISYNYVTLTAGCEVDLYIYKYSIMLIIGNTTDLRRQLVISMAVFVAESERLRLQTLNVEEHLQDYFEIMSAPASMFWS